MKKLIYILSLTSFLTISCQNEDIALPKANYPQYFSAAKSEIRDFTVFSGSSEGAIETTGNYSPDEIWGVGRLSISPKTITLCNDSIIKFDNGEKVYKLSMDSIYIRNYDFSWSKIGYLNNNNLLYHIALTYIYLRPEEGVQLLSVENIYKVFNYDIFFETYQLSTSDFNLDTEKAAWCNIYTTYKLN